MIKIDIQKSLFGVNKNMDLSIKLDIMKGEFLALSGVSGSGKTTLLRVLAGLENANGEIEVNQNIWQKNNFSLKPQKREIGFVFQDYALFLNMSVEQNLLYVKNDKVLANNLLKISELESLKKQNVTLLSGGQKQRVALCRALMNNPKLLLLDEPLSALDTKIRKKLQNMILKLHKEFDLTTILVSHEPSEIYKLCTRVIQLENGKIINDGTPKEVLLKTSGSQKFSFEGELLDIIKVDVIYIAIVAIGQQLVEVVVSENEAKNLKIGSKVQVGTKAFAPNIKFI